MVSISDSTFTYWLLSRLNYLPIVSFLIGSAIRKHPRKIHLFTLCTLNFQPPERTRRKLHPIFNPPQWQGFLLRARAVRSEVSNIRKKSQQDIRNIGTLTGSVSQQLALYNMCNYIYFKIWFYIHNRLYFALWGKTRVDFCFGFFSLILIRVLLLQTRQYIQFFLHALPSFFVFCI